MQACNCVDVACTSCAIVVGTVPASIVEINSLTAAFVDLRQFHHGHVHVIPRSHIADVRSVDDTMAAALIAAVAQVVDVLCSTGWP